jgi:hypothetical protein
MPTVRSRIHCRRVVNVALAITVGAVSTLGLAGVASAASPIVHRVSAGGPDACAAIGARPGCDSNYSLTAVEYADGSVSGSLTDRFSRGFGSHADIDCLAVEGNRAWVSGVVTSGLFVGQYILASVQDNGTSANDPPDQISRSMFDPEPFDCTSLPDVELLDAPQGQVVVR